VLQECPEYFQKEYGMKILSVAVMAVMVASMANAALVTDPLCRDVTAPVERGTVLNFRGNFDGTWGNDPLLSPSTSPYVFTGNGGSYGYIQYVAPTGQAFDKLTASIAYIGVANGVEVRDAGYNLVTSVKTTAVTDAKSVSWYTVTFDKAANTAQNSDLSSLYLVVYYGSWGAGYTSVGTVQLSEQPVPEPATIGLLMGSVMMLRRRK
jgi:hypothetical protein